MVVEILSDPMQLLLYNVADEDHGSVSIHLDCCLTGKPAEHSL